MTTRTGRTSHLGTAWLIWRQASANLLPSLAIAVLVFVIAGLATAAPRAVSTMFTDSLRYAAASLPAPQRDLVAGTWGGPLAGPSAHPEHSGLPTEVDAVWGRQQDALASLRAGMPEALRRAVGPAEYLVMLDSAHAGTTDPNRGVPDTQLILSLDPNLPGRVVITDGTAPAPIAGGVPSDAPVDILLSQQSAQRIDLQVGGERILTVGHSPQRVRLAGVFRARDAHDAYWSHTPGALEPSVLSAGKLEPTITALAYVDPASWAPLHATGARANTLVWFPVRANALSATDAARFATELRAFSRAPHQIGSGPVSDSALQFPPQGFPATMLGFTTRLGLTLQNEAVRAAMTGAVLAMAASGPVGVAFAVLLLGARLILDRRRQALALAAARGATVGQLRAVLALEGAAIGLPAALLGVVVGSILPGDSSAAALLVPAAIGLAPAILLPALVSLPRLRHGRTDLGQPRAGRGRWVAEAMVVGLAVVSVVVLLQRGVTTSAAAVGVDPLLAATPLLLALAACVLVARVYPLPLRRLSDRLKARRGVAGFLGSARALRDPAAGFVPILAMVVAVAVAVFSVALLSTLTAGIDTAARATVGADLRVNAPYLSQNQLSAIAHQPGVRQVAPVYAEVTSTITIDGATRTVSVVVADTDELRSVQRAVSGALDLPRSLGRSGSAAVPVVLSSDLAELLEPDSEVLSNGDALDVVATAPSTGPLTARRSWLLVDRANADRLVVPEVAPGVALVRLTPAAHPDAVANDLRTLLGAAASVTVPSAVARATAAVPAAGGLSVALLVAVIVAWVLSGAAIVLTLVLNAPGRERMLSLLRALGLGRRGARRLIGWEIGPVTLAAAVVGGLVGAALPFVVLAGVDLRPFTGGAGQPAVVYDPVLLVAAVAAFAVVVSAGTWLALAAARRLNAAAMLRTIEEG